MKALPWICGLSLAANLAFAVFFRPSPSLLSATADAHAAPIATQPALAPEATPGAPAAFTRADTALAKILDGSDLRAMRDALEATGLTAEDAKALIRTRIRERQKPLREAIDRRRGPQDDTWWYQDDEARNRFEEQRRADRKALDSDTARTLAALFGPEAPAPEKETIHAQARFLPEAKRLAVSQILRDYEAMEREGRPRNYSGATLPSDEEKRRFIAEERRRDLAAVLSPEELRAYDLRHSQTAQDLRWRLAGMKPSLAEYEAIFDMQNELDRRYDTRTNDERPPDFWQKRQEAEQTGLAHLRQELGEDRYIDFALSNDHSSRQVDLVVERFALPADTTRRLWQLRQEAGRQGKAIYDDQKLSQDEKRARIADLARRSREDLDRALGPEAQTELKQNNLVTWVAGLEKNHISVYSDTGNSSSGYGL